MLEVLHLSKIYKTKGGADVKALDDVSLRFPEKGMVFLLGKSGSGKSTLLNVCGGLDDPSGGEIIVKGRSSKSFSQSDFDSYRNTFIGFIFQEYNILNEFSVEENIALALELQGKPKDKEAVANLLEEVDLTGYAKRKPNTLSGGQKQRIAIARALIKSPEIIMADEPTGALDSATGKQVFDTLKKLSRDKLIIVVSHDREFAEQYGDRIIELKDGKILSDVSKTQEEQTVLSEGVSAIGDTLCIKKGTKLSEKDFATIKEFLSKADGDVLIAGGEKDVKSFKEINRITDDGEREVFRDTDEKKIEKKAYKPEDSRFIRSRLPFRHAIHMGASGLKHKKFRLVMTVFLSLIAFALSGFADTLAAYDKMTAAVDSIYDSNVRNASVTLGLRHTSIYGDGDTSTYYDNATLNDEDIAFLKTQTGLNFVPVFTGSRHGGYYNGGFSVTGSMKNYIGGTVYTGKIHGLVAMTDDMLASVGLSASPGRLPTAAGEIAITDLLYRQFNEYGFKDAETGEEIKAGELTTATDGSPNSIIGKSIEIRSEQGTSTFLEIVGIVDTHFDYERYADFLPSDKDDPSEEEGNMIESMILQMEIESEIGYGFHALGFAHADDIKTISENTYFDKKEIGTYMYFGSKSMNLTVSITSLPSGKEDEDLHSEKGTITQVAGSDALKDVTVTWLNGEKTKLGKDEIILPIYYLDLLLPNSFVWEINCDELDTFMTDKYGAAWTNNREGFNNLYDNLCSAAWEYYGGEYGHEVIVEKLQTDTFPFFFEQLGIEMPEAGMRLTYGLHTEMENLLRGLSNDNGSMTTSVESYQLSGVLRALYADHAVPKYNLAKDDAFRKKMDTHYYGDDIESRAEDEIARDAYYFYKNHYLAWSDKDFGYDSNPYGKSGKELDAIAKDILTQMSGATAEKLANNVEFTLSSKEWRDGNEVNTGVNTKNYTVVGFYNNISNYHFGDFAISDTLLAEFEQWRLDNLDEYSSIEETAKHNDGIWAYTLAPLTKDKDIIEKLVALSYAEDGVDLKFEMQNYVMDTLDSFNDFIEIGAQIFLYVGLGFAVFSALLLMNFISTSISYKKREIGVLRAVGARSSDVFKIFFSEALMIALINFVLSTAVVITGIFVANTAMHNEGITITLLNYGVRQFVLMLVISVGVALLASFLPVNRIAKKKPVESIRAL